MLSSNSRSANLKAMGPQADLPAPGLGFICKMGIVVSGSQGKAGSKVK